MEQYHKNDIGSSNDDIIPWYLIGVVAIICAVVLLVIAILGPAVLGTIHYRSSQSGIWQIMGGDLVNLVLMVPLLLIGGVLQLMRKSTAKYFLILTPITLMYTGLMVGIGQEWGNPAYTGNVEFYAWLYMVLVIGGLILLVGTLSMFTPRDAPNFNRRSLRIFVAVMALALLMFAFMWISELTQVMTVGDTTTGSYTAAPTSWWVIKFLDLGVTIPLGYLALFLLMSKPQRAYSLVLLFFGFFLTTGTAVNMMAVIMVMNNDPSIGGANAGGLVIFPLLGALVYGCLFYLVRDKITKALGRPGRA